ncbi:MAG TPA: amidohydrolase family protein [Candidatus Eisenbacteria bacterium]|nr:amidohydrolase family protein [Candidatus Eisenbacteria bacterium]
MAENTIYHGGTIVALDDASTVLTGDVLVQDGVIRAIGGPFDSPESSGAARVDCTDALVVPGFVQAHVHLSQALFRGLAEEADLLRWLERKIWPFEAAHTAESLRASARLGLAEMIRTGTTTVCDMGAMRHAEVLAHTVEESGVRAVVSRLLMDQGHAVPPALVERASKSLQDAQALARRFDGADGGRLRFALAPRFVLSCSGDLLRQVAAASKENGWLVHTHLNESKNEIAATEKALGRGTVAYFDELGLLSERFIAAHGVWFIDWERACLAARKSSITHCPSANFKLGSGLCDTKALVDGGVTVGLGADGLPCNNRADAFEEMRLAGLLSRLLHGEQALSSERILRMATIEGARALGFAGRTGSIEVGKRADLVVVDHTGTGGTLLEGTSVYDALVYQLSAAHVRAVCVDGRLLYRNGELLFADETEILAQAQVERVALMRRARV